MAEWDKVWSRLSAHFQPFLQLLAGILTILDKKYCTLMWRDKREPYLIVLQQNKVQVCQKWLRLTFCLSLIWEPIFLLLSRSVSHLIRIVTVFETISLSRFLSLYSSHCHGLSANLFPFVAFLSQSPS